MDYLERLEKLDGFIKKCEGFNEEIIQSMFWNVNDDVILSESIDKKNSDWRVFENNVNTYFMMHEDGEKKRQYQSIVGRFDIDESVISDLIVLFNQMKDDIRLEMKKQTFNNTNEDKELLPIQNLIADMSKIKRNFSNKTIARSGTGSVAGISTISGNSEFEKWKALLKYELQHLKQDVLVKEIIDILDSFNGWSDTRLFTQLEAKLQIIDEKIELYACDTEEVEVSNNKIFIVHGRNEGVRDKVELLLRRAGLEPIILAEQASRGMTIIEKIESNSDVAFSVVLYTGCDEGKLKEESDLHPRARQNVVFEHGYMVAKLGRDKVVALTESGVEKPGDLAGVIYVSLSDKDWERQMFKELESGGLQINWSKT